MTSKLFQTEADLVAAFCRCVEAHNSNRNRTAGAWMVYHETADWDLLLVAEDGYQVGVEAKLSLNAKVLDQALPGRYGAHQGPDYRAVLVPCDGLQLHISSIARHVGITVIALSEWSKGRYRVTPDLPDERSAWDQGDWHSWHPALRCKLPEYLPDVSGGKPSPLRLTEWKIRAIKLMILLDQRGVVTRADMKALKLSPSRWTDAYHGFLARTDAGYVRCGATPDLKAQHPKNWAEIEADFDKWAPPPTVPASLFGSAA